MLLALFGVTVVVLGLFSLIYLGMRAVRHAFESDEDSRHD